MWGLSGLHTDKADAQHLVLLRARRERPNKRRSRRRTANEHNELAPSHVEHRHSRASSHPGTAARAAGDGSRYLGKVYAATLRG